MKAATLLLWVIAWMPLLAQSDANIGAAYRASYNYEKMQNYPDAVKALLPVYDVYPETYTVNLRLGWLYYLSTHYVNAIEHYDRAIKSLPFSLEAKLGRLLPLLAQERYSQVEKEAFQILNIDYYNYFGNLRLLIALRAQEKYDVAEKIALKMLAIYPIDVLFLNEFALTKIAQGDTTAGRNTFQSIQILDPENVSAKRFLEKQ